jgi:hypothetical protein
MITSAAVFGMPVFAMDFLRICKQSDQVYLLMGVDHLLLVELIKFVTLAVAMGLGQEHSTTWETKLGSAILELLESLRPHLQ